MNPLDTALNFQTQALKLSSQRQQLLASNIANADTPKYRASDMNFAQALERATGASHAVTLKTSAPNDIGPSLFTDTTDAVIESTATEPTLDGNTVDMDTQRAQFADATMHYQAAFTFLNAKIKTLLSAIQG